MNRSKKIVWGCIITAVALLLAVVLLIPAIIKLTAEPQIKDFAGCQLSREEFDALTEKRNLCGTSLLTGMEWNGQSLAFASQSGDWYYSLVENDPNGLTPTVAWESVWPVKLAIVGEITEETISQSQPIEVIAYTLTKYSLYRVYSTTLPVITLSSQVQRTDVGDELCKMKISLFDNRETAEERVTASEGKIRIRGETTKVLPKKGYKISLGTWDTNDKRTKNSVSFLGMRKDDDWILYPAYNDPEKIRNVFCTRLWWDGCAADNSFGLQNGNEYRYVEIVWNGEYVGLWALGSPVDTKTLDVSGEEALYKKKLWTDESALDFNDVSQSDGVYKIDTDADPAVAWRRLGDYFELCDSENPDRQALYDCMDLDNSLDVYLFLDVVQGSDNLNNGTETRLKNMYIASKQTDRGWVMLYTPWDLDNCFGSCYAGDQTNLTAVYGVTPERSFRMRIGSLAALLKMEDAEAEQALRDKYAELRSGAWSDETIAALLDEYEAEIYGSGAFLREQVC